MKKDDGSTNKTGENQKTETENKAGVKRKKATPETDTTVTKNDPIEKTAVAPSDTENRPLVETQMKEDKPPDDKPEKKDRLTRLLEKRKALSARIQQEENRLNAKKRKLETRRKILAGAWLLDEIEKEKDFKEVVYKKLDGFLTRPEDRALFGLPPLPDKSDDKTGGLL